MATLTITLDPELLKAAKLEAERRHITRHIPARNNSGGLWVQDRVAGP
jgi:hypothetical protein